MAWNIHRASPRRPTAKPSPGVRETMAIVQASQPTFSVTHESQPSPHLVCGFSSFGLAGLTAVDFLVDQLDLEETGYVTTEALPPITPFTDGVPRHHTRLFSRPDLEVTVLLNELFVPLAAADGFARAVLDWTDANGVEEITIASGVPVPHGPDEHEVFYVATPDYRGSRLEGAAFRAMGNGFLNGVNAALVGRGLDTPLRVGVVVTPVHHQVPDVDAAIRLVEAVATLYGLDVATAGLVEFAEQVEAYYRDLEAHLQAAEVAEVPEDRMYM